MKAIFGGIIAAILIAFGSAVVLDREVQRTAQEAFATIGVRL